ncbi:MAG: DUF5688 family protein [Anaerocolumna sp.]
MANNEIFEVFGFGKFLSLMQKSVKEAVGAGYSVEINHVIKNNSIELEGLIILKDSERITPNIYLNPYYERYLTGDPFEGLVDEIIQVYRNTREVGEKNDLSIRYEFNEMKPYIIYRLINYDRNRKLLMEVPHVHFMDLAITFHCLVKNNEKGIGTIRITNEHINTWNINIEELKEIARINTPALFPPVVKSMNDVIQDIFKNELHTFSQSDSYSEDSTIFDGLSQHETNNMYVISNLKGINGASCLLYPNVMKDLAEELNSDLYILPSSIHEVIVVKGNASMDKNTFREMVFDVNRTQVPDEDVLSDNVYFYSRERNAITM